MCFMNAVNKLSLNGYSLREGTIRVQFHENKIGLSDSAKVQDKV